MYKIGCLNNSENRRDEIIWRTVFAHDWLEVGWAVREYLGFRLDIALGLEKKRNKKGMGMQGLRAP